MAELNRRVLFVDDEPNVLQAYQRLIRDEFEVAVAESGADALKLLSDGGSFAVIVSDYKMPGMNGIELLSRVQEIAPDVIRVMLTGHGDVQTAIAAINHGAVFRFLNKPCSHSSLIETVQEAVEQYALIQNARLDNERIIVRRSQKEAFDKSIEAVNLMLSKRDPYTASHQVRCACLARAIGLHLGMEDDQMELLYISARVHDIGKFFVPADILTRSGKLTDVEFMLIQTHSRNGYEILQLMDFYHPVADVVLQHHERLDGSGYPQGLSGESICLEAKIIAVADVVEAMHTQRPYRPALGIDMALDEISRNSGRLYEKDVVNACLYLFERGFKFL